MVRLMERFIFVVVRLLHSLTERLFPLSVLLPFSSADNTMDIAPKVMDRTYCENIAKNMMHAKDLPVECQTKYSDIVHELKRRDTDTTHPTQFLS
jgi:hypothetical protein